MQQTVVSARAHHKSLLSNQACIELSLPQNKRGYRGPISRSFQVFYAAFDTYFYQSCTSQVRGMTLRALGNKQMVKKSLIKRDKLSTGLPCRPLELYERCCL